MSKADQVFLELSAEFANSSYGKVGDRFLTVRELALQKHISLKTAFAIFGILKKNGMIVKEKKSYFINSLESFRKNLGEMRLIGCIVTTLDSPYFATLVRCLEEEIHQFGACLLVASSEYNFQREQERINTFVARGVSGIFVCPWADEAEEEFYNTVSVPMVMLGRKLKNVRQKTVIVNNQSSAQKVAAHLIDIGCEHFAYIGQNVAKRDDRLFGFRAELLEQGRKLPMENIIHTDYQDHQKCLDNIEALLGRKPKGRLGIFCYHDLFASRVIMLCHKKGFDVPGEVAVAGFDDLPIAEELSPPLTTVRYPVKSIARIAAESLYARLKLGSGGENTCSYVNAELIVRESTKKF
ncbi:MAG: LacI family transcriptional regulator [Victivallales bacterium]|jgi:LacI family transcriptional regulator|nr:LacI family transcriptional regulator [Victivallales bacterium]